MQLAFPYRIGYTGRTSEDRDTQERHQTRLRNG